VCKVCKKAHWGAIHVWDVEAPLPQPVRPYIVKIVVNTPDKELTDVVNTKRKKYPDTDARRAYMAAYMKKYRLKRRNDGK